MEELPKANSELLSTRFPIPQHESRFLEINMNSLKLTVISKRDIFFLREAEINAANYSTVLRKNPIAFSFLCLP